MALSLEQKIDKYVDTPLTNFPVKEDTFDRMMDVTSELIQLVIEYNKYFQAGNMAECNKLMQDNPDLIGCFFNADKYNQIRDAIIALERYYLEDIEPFINDVAQHALGLNDTPVESEKHLAPYSARKTEEMIRHAFRTYEEVIPVTFTSSGWTGAQAPYTQTVNVGIINEEDKPTLVKYYNEAYSSERIKEYNKTFGLFADGLGFTGNGTVTWQCNKKPSSTITIGLRGVFSNIVFPSADAALFKNMDFGYNASNDSIYFGRIDGDKILMGNLDMLNTTVENKENNNG